jgi:hypothetical protein
LKSVHPEAAKEFLALADLKGSEPKEGRDFFVVEVDKETFVSALPGIVQKILDANVPTAEPSIEIDESEEDKGSYGETAFFVAYDQDE